MSGHSYADDGRYWHVDAGEECEVCELFASGLRPGVRGLSDADQKLGARIKGIGDRVAALAVILREHKDDDLGEAAIEAIDAAAALLDDRAEVQHYIARCYGVKS